MSLPEPYYQDDACTIYHGDCLDILPHVNGNSIDMIFTDPPYGHNNNNGDLASRWEDALGVAKPGAVYAPRPIANDGAEATGIVRMMFSHAMRVLKPGCCCCCCCGGGGPDPQFARWALMLDEEIGFKQMIPWDKGGLGMGWHYRRSYEVVLVGEKPGAACKWYGGNSTPNIVRGINGIIPQAGDHPTPKPLALVYWFLRCHSRAGDLVLDPFMGGGTTLRAAKDLGRRAIGIELEEKYCEMAAKRLEQGALPLWGAP